MIGLMMRVRALAIICALALTGTAMAESTTRVVIEGSVKRGEEFSQDFGPGFTFRLKGKDVWGIVITHATSPDRDLIYPVNPPYRFTNRQYLGPGYGESARDSVGNTPRQFALVCRPRDIERAWADLDRVLWPYNHPEAEIQKAIDDLGRIQTGTTTFEVLSAQVGPDESQPGAEEWVRGVKFRVTITWPPSP